MSRENVEVQRLSVDAINARELTDELLARVCTPDFVMAGAQLDLAWIHVMGFQDGKMSRGAGYTNRHDALKAVGLQK